MADDFGSFATADTGSVSANNASFAAFGDFTAGSVGSATPTPQPSSAFSDLGDFGGFGSSAGVVKTEGASTNSFGDFDSFENSERNIPESNGQDPGLSEADFGDFGAFSTVPAVGVKPRSASVTATSSRSGSVAGVSDAYVSRNDSLDSDSNLGGDFGSFGNTFLAATAPPSANSQLIDGLGDSSTAPDLRGAETVSATGQVLSAGNDFDGFGDFGPVSNSAADDGDFGGFPGQPSQADTKPAVRASGSAGFGDFGSLMSGGSGGGGDNGHGSGGGSAMANATLGSAHGSQTASPALPAKGIAHFGSCGDAFGDFGSVQSGAAMVSGSGLSSGMAETSSPGLLPKVVSPGNEFGDFGSFGATTVHASGARQDLQDFGGAASSSAALKSNAPEDFGDFGTGPASSVTNTRGFGSFDDPSVPAGGSIGSGVVFPVAAGSDKSSPATLRKVVSGGDFGSASIGTRPSAASGNSFGAFGGSASSSPLQRRSDAFVNDDAGLGSLPPAASTAASAGKADDASDEFAGFGSFSSTSKTTSTAAFGAFGGQEKPEANSADTGGDFGDFGAFNAPSTAPAAAAAAAADDGFGAFNAPSTAPAAAAAADDGFGSFNAPSTAPAAAAAADDGFGDFGSTPAAGGEDDGFGDFGAFGSGGGAPVADNNAFGTFAAPAASTGFQAAPTSSTAAGDGDDFAGFGSFGAGTSNTSSAFSSAPAPALVVAQPPVALKSFASARETLKASFPAVSCSDVSSGRAVGLQSSLLSGGPWAELGRVGERPLASFDKMASRIRCDFLSALKVEGSLIGVQSGQHQVPAFAAGLGLLRPSGSPALSLAGAAGVVAPMVPGDDPFSMDTARPVSPLDLFGTAAAAPTAAYRFSNEERAPGPMSSGAPALLDLTLESTLAHSNAPTSVISDPLLQSDLMGLDLTFSSDVMPLAEEELYPRAPTPTVPTKPKALSPEMERMIDSLPDLSFMLSKVLMFPAVLTS